MSSPWARRTAGHDDAVGMQATNDSRPIHRVYVDGFWMDTTEVTNEQFATFVKATGYVTVAERTPRAEDFPARPGEPGRRSVVFSPPNHAVPLNDHFQWWTYVEGGELAASARTRRATIKGKGRYPVVHVAYEDAEAYASGPANGCRPRRSGNSRRAVG